MTASFTGSSAVNAGAILQQTPNGVLVVDKETRIRFVNPAFRRMFHCEQEDPMGRPAAELIHSDCFERAISGNGSLTIKRAIPEHDVYFRAGLFPVEGEGLYCGIFIDIADEEKAIKNIQALRSQMRQRALQVTSRQMQTAQEIARLLGESTAETKVLLVKLMRVFYTVDPHEEAEG